MEKYMVVSEAYYQEYGLGLIFESKEEQKQFAERVLDKLEVSIGEMLSEGKTDEELDDFDLCTSDEEISEWLETHRPEFPQIIESCRQKMKMKLWSAFGSIPGTLVTNVAVFRHTPVSELELSEKCRQWIEQNDVFTIGDLIITMKNDSDLKKGRKVLYTEMNEAITKYLENNKSIVYKIPLVKKKDIAVKMYEEYKKLEEEMLCREITCEGITWD